MATPMRVGARELTSTQIIDALQSGRRVVVEQSVLGRTMHLSIREHQGTYYCDTPVLLLTFDTREELRKCLERYRLAKRTDPAETPTTGEVADGG